MGPEGTFACMKQAYDLGINFFDTAERWVSEACYQRWGICHSDDVVATPEASPRWRWGRRSRSLDGSAMTLS